MLRTSSNPRPQQQTTSTRRFTSVRDVRRGAPLLWQLVMATVATPVASTAARVAEDVGEAASPPRRQAGWRTCRVGPHAGLNGATCASRSRVAVEEGEERCDKGADVTTSDLVAMAIRLQRAFRKVRRMYSSYGPLLFCESRGLPAAYGSLAFDNGTKSARFLQLANTSSTNVLVGLMLKHWQLPHPELILSVTGGALDFSLSASLRSAFTSGLMKAAIGSKAWIFTGGTDAGIMKVSMYACAYVHISLGMPLRSNRPPDIRVLVRTCPDSHGPAETYAHTHTHTHTHAHAHTDLPRPMHIHIHMHMHTRTCRDLCRPSQTHSEPRRPMQTDTRCDGMWIRVSDVFSSWAMQFETRVPTSPPLASPRGA